MKDSTCLESFSGTGQTWVSRDSWGTFRPLCIRAGQPDPLKNSYLRGCDGNRGYVFQWCSYSGRSPGAERSTQCVLCGRTSTWTKLDLG